MNTEERAHDEFEKWWDDACNKPEGPTAKAGFYTAWDIQQKKLNNLIEAAENTSYMIEQYMKGNQTTVGLLSGNMRLKKAIKGAKNDQP